MIDALATEQKLYDRVRPIWDALPVGARGRMYVGERLMPKSDEAHHRGELRRPGPRVLVASWHDYRETAPQSVAGQPTYPGRRVVLGEHGAGQSYAGDPTDRNACCQPCYAGGDQRERCDLFLVPGSHPAKRNRARWPDTPCVEVGDPGLDRFVGIPRPSCSDPLRVGISFHWPNSLCEESGSAFGHFSPGLSELAERFTLLTHAHPRALPMVWSDYERHRLRWASRDEILTTADVVAVDNSSLGFEFAALGRPVVWLQPPWWRDVPHGLRFGPEAGSVGLMCCSPEALPGAIHAAALSACAGYGASQAAIRSVYTHFGDSAQRAAQAILALDDQEAPMLAGAAL